MKLIENIKRILFAITHPTYWIQNQPYNAELDKAINDLDWNKIKVISEYNAEIDGMTLWIANHPYSSFYIGNRLPSRLTRHRLMKKIEQKLAEFENNRMREAIKAKKTKE